MDWLNWQWVTEHPAEAAWAVMGALTVLIAVYSRFEDQLKERALASTTKVDDKIVNALGFILGWTTFILDAARLLVPHVATKTAHARKPVLPRPPPLPKIPPPPPGAEA